MIQFFFFFLTFLLFRYMIYVNCASQIKLLDSATDPTKGYKQD